MKAPTYEQKAERAFQQHEAVEKSKGKPGPRFNQYMKMRKAKHKSTGGSYANK